MRAELDAVTAGFNKLPVLAGANGRLVIVNAGATALDSTAVISISGTTVTFGGAVTGITDLTTTGNTTLGNAVGDTLSISGSVVKNDTGNWTIPAPSSGINLNLVQAAGSTTLNSTDGTVIARLTHSSTQTTFGNQTSHQLNFETGAATRVSIGTTGAVTIAAPSSGIALTVSPLAGQTAIAITGAATGAVGALSITDGTITSVWQANNTSQSILGTSSNHPLNLMTNAASRVSIAAAGNVTIVAPSSGIALTVSGFAGTHVQKWNGPAAAAASLYLSAVAGQLAVLRIGGNALDAAGFDLQQDSAGAVDIVNRSNARLSLYTNALERLQIAAAGNVTINAPSSGRSLTLGAFSGAAAFAINSPAAQLAYQVFAVNSTDYGYLGTAGAAAQLINDSGGIGEFLIRVANKDFRISTNDGSSSAFKIAADGRVSGKFLHNVGTVTGTTDQYIASGTYTPTVTNVTNISSNTPLPCQWLRVGNVVTVSGVVGLTTTGAGACEVGISLPIASALTATEQLSGSSAQRSTGSEAGVMDCDTTNDRAAMRFTAGSGAANARGFHFTYLIL